MFRSTVSRVLLASILFATNGGAAINTCLQPSGSKCSAGVEHLNVADCGITDDDMSDFGNCLDIVGRADIVVMDFTGNKLTTVPPGTFEGMSKLTTLVLNDNPLTSLHVGSFDGLSNLRLLDFMNHELTTLPSGVFSALTKLETLYLWFSGLETLPLGVFNGLSDLVFLTLKNNRLTALPAGLFAGVGTPDYLLVSLANNPDLQCIPEIGDQITLFVDEDLPTCVGDGPGTGGDPHMIGFKGQKIDWKGEDGAWYTLLSSGPDMQMSVRLTAPLPEDFPDRQLITGFAIAYEGDHSVVIESTTPYTTEIEGCAGELQASCLSEGAVSISVDGDDYLPLTTENAVLPGGAILTAFNLPAECQPFGGDVDWAHAFEEMNASRRLDTEHESIAEWMYGWSASTAAPSWCEKFVEESDVEGLLEHRSKHAVFRIQTPSLSVRLHHGTNHQGGETLEDGRVLPELEFWQMDLHVEWATFDSDLVTGILGETMRPVLDAAGRPILAGKSALRGEVDDYRISGPLASDFRGPQT